ncbi:MAG: hypothetical protein LUO89_12725 [Methanothrix sp.]|nr:hypothetical protein [Methanothrix sp.]
MSLKLPVISGKEAVKAFSRGGWHVDRIAGSHIICLTPSIASRTKTAASPGAVGDAGSGPFEVRFEEFRKNTFASHG